VHTSTNAYRILLVGSSFVGLGVVSCTPPGDPEPPPIATEEGFGGGESGVDEDNFVIDGHCLTSPGGTKGYRHHCGGNLAFEVTGKYFDGLAWQATDFGMLVGFGPTYADEWLEDDDVYETPFVAACCGGPYNFANPDPDYPNNYALNCALDAVQQLCAALPRYYKALGDNSGLVKQALYYDIADYLNDAVVQGECVLSLYEGSDPEHLIQNRNWQIIDTLKANYKLTIDSLEVLEWDYPAKAADVAECSSILDNDDHVIPLVEELLGDAQNFMIAAGNGALTNNENLTVTLDPEASSLLSTVLKASSNELEIRNFVLRGGATSIMIDATLFSVERWSLRLVTPVVASQLGEGYTYPAGSMTIVANVFVGGDAISLIGTNAATVNVVAGSTGWVVRGFEVGYNANGMLWTYAQTADLEFN
jgi:hypothetical protein